ncbi:1,4-dihydroxy-2-naphthoate polyprenyltransferase [Peptococcus simiae]|uniref:1,4-dihydroxy-2-naphthoate octaprenyltransferase n=1 Tax=Peptococcus simiae TaxID=1643805 RepID=A0ABW9GX74_9FIRM
MRSIDFWWRMIRPHTLSASFIPVFVGTALAMQESGRLRDLILLAMLAASVLIQIAANLLNEYFDFHSGLDTQASIGIGGTIVHDGLSPSFVLRTAFVCLGLAVLLGLYLAWSTSWWLLLVGALCVLIAFLYAGGPLPLSRTPFGEIFAGGTMGAGITCIAYYVQLGKLTTHVLWVAFPIFILIGLILTANNLRDRVGDQKGGRRTLVILLGHRKSVIFIACGLALAYLWTFVLLGTGHKWVILLPWLSAWRVRKVIGGFSRENQSPAEMMPAMAQMSKLNRDYGSYLALALILESFLP